MSGRKLSSILSILGKVRERVFHAQIAETRGNSIDNSLAALETEEPQRFAETVFMDARRKVAGERRDSSKVYPDRRIG